MSRREQLTVSETISVVTVDVFFGGGGRGEEGITTDTYSVAARDSAKRSTMHWTVLHSKE